MNYFIDDIAEFASTVEEYKKHQKKRPSIRSWMAKGNLVGGGLGAVSIGGLSLASKKNRQVIKSVGETLGGKTKVGKAVRGLGALAATGGIGGAATGGTVGLGAGIVDKIRRGKKWREKNKKFYKE